MGSRAARIPEPGDLFEATAVVVPMLVEAPMTVLIRPGERVIVMPRGDGVPPRGADEPGIIDTEDPGWELDALPCLYSGGLVWIGVDQIRAKMRRINRRAP